MPRFYVPVWHTVRSAGGSFWTDRLIRAMCAALLCKFESTPPRFTRIYNEYSSVKSGWELRLDVM